jgi:hypothetical protein
LDFDFTHRWQAGDSFREEAVKGNYDLKDVMLEKRICGSLPIEGLNWQIGVIVGSSGSGKTSIARHQWPQAYFADLHERYKESCFLNDFPPELSVKDIGTALCSSGFSEPPSWLKSYAVLSQRQKMRVDVAHALCLPQNWWFSMSSQARWIVLSPKLAVMLLAVLSVSTRGNSLSL